jgi:hypothetical protein
MPPRRARDKRNLDEALLKHTAGESALHRQSARRQLLMKVTKQSKRSTSFLFSLLYTPPLSPDPPFLVPFMFFKRP